jgi:hypothetical protein
MVTRKSRLSPLALPKGGEGLCRTDRPTGHLLDELLVRGATLGRKGRIYVANECEMI